MHDMKRQLIELIKQLMNGEKITIYGDYDADGITATSIMMDTLEIFECRCPFFYSR